jgi:predicted nucleic acid-binding protein
MVLVDTTPLVALCDGRDGKSRTAVKQLQRLAGDGLAVCEAVLTEACFHLPHESQRLRLRALLRELNIRCLPLAHDRGEWLDVFDWLIKYEDHEPDWADACIAVLSGRIPDLQVWTFDREFRTVWRRPNETAIPIVGRSSRA